MADFKTHKTFKNTNFEVLTHEGFKNFKGLMVGKNHKRLSLKFSNNKEIKCTPKHKLVLKNEKFITPSLESGCLPGITRQILIKHFDISEELFTWDEMLESDACYLFQRQPD